MAPARHGDGPMRCTFCGAVLHGPVDGVAFGVAGRPILTTCREHAGLVEQGAQTVKRVAVIGLRRLLQEKAPTAFGLIQEVYAQAQLVSHSRRE